jgi:hypothetical protein
MKIKEIFTCKLQKRPKFQQDIGLITLTLINIQVTFSIGHNVGSRIKRMVMPTWLFDGGVHSGVVAFLCNQSMITILKEKWWINPWLQEITFFCHAVVALLCITRIYHITTSHCICPGESV